MLFLACGETFLRLQGGCLISFYSVEILTQSCLLLRIGANANFESPSATEVFMDDNEFLAEDT